MYKATAYGGFGERLLKRMGWEEGRGLGTNQHGIKSAIEVKKKEDQAGVWFPNSVNDVLLYGSLCGWSIRACIRMQVGGKAGFAWEKKWWEEAYDSKLQKLQVGIKMFPCSQI